MMVTSEPKPRLDLLEDLHGFFAVAVALLVQAGQHRAVDVVVDDSVGGHRQRLDDNGTHIRGLTLRATVAHQAGFSSTATAHEHTATAGSSPRSYALCNRSPPTAHRRWGPPG